MTRIADLPAHLRPMARAALRGAPEPTGTSEGTRGPQKGRSVAGRAIRVPAADPFPALCAAAGLPAPVAEHRFHPRRRWRFDYAWPAQRVALEVEGGVWTGGRHTRPAGFLGDVAKYNAAAAAGWRVLRCTPATRASAETLALLRDTLTPTEGA